mgnify:CR=1 FL=1
MIHIESMGAQFHFCVPLSRAFVKIRLEDRTRLFLQATYHIISQLAYRTSDEVSGSKPEKLMPPSKPRGLAGTASYY